MLFTGSGRPGSRRYRELQGRICRHHHFPVTYAGGIRQPEDLTRIAELSGGSLDVTVGSALKIFGGDQDLYELAAAADRLQKILRKADSDIQ